MSNEEPSGAGPDLRTGVPLRSLGEGQMLQGHVDGKPAMLIRRGDTVFAVGAVCSHYGGPLAEGLLVGETVRCPWHHACFSLRTGEALRAPALHPLPCWEVSQRDGMVYVTTERVASEATAPGRSNATSAEPAKKTPPQRSVVIVGGGAAGDSAADHLRREGFAGRITVLSADADAPYDRPNISKDYLAGTAPESWIPLRSLDSYEERQIDLRLGVRVTDINVANRFVQLDDGTTVPFDALVLATGANAVHLPPRMDPLQRVMYLRTLADSRAIVEASKNAGHAVVIGASFIGLEVAAALRTRGLYVDIVAPDRLPLERILGTELGAIIQRIHEDHGATFHLGNAIASVGNDHVILASGERLQADLVVAGIGVRPDLSLAAAAGLKLERGVLVDEYLETSVAGVYAAGDIAQWTDAASGESRRIEHWVVAERQGAAVAHNIAAHFDGRLREPFSAVPFFWSAHYDTTISYVGHADSWDEACVSGDFRDGRIAVTYRNAGRDLAVATVGEDILSLDTEQAMERAADIALQHGIESDATLGRHKPSYA